MTAIGIDLGGTKIETQVFAPDWSVQCSQRIATPQTYDALVAAVAGQVAWADQITGARPPVGIGAAGLLHPVTGLTLAANLPITDKSFPADIAGRIGRPVTYINDSRAVTLSEAVFGAGKGHRTVMALILGTGVGGGIAIDGQLLTGPTTTGGEYGHIAAPAHLISAYDLPVIKCGCGRMGCAETLISGTGLSRIARVIMNGDFAAPAIIAARDTDPLAQTTWSIWCALTAEVLLNMILIADPDCIVLAGGLSTISDVTNDLSAAVAKAQLPGFPTPPIRLAQGGETSGARGAAYAASLS